MIAEDPKSEEIIKPILRGRDIKRYHTNWAKLWLIATFPSLHLDIENYPAIKRHLLTYGKEKLEQAGKTLPDGSKSRKRTPHAWFELQDTCAYHAEFSKEKILYPNMTKYLPFLYDDKKFYANDKSFIITGRDIKYLCSVFNSKVASWWIKENCPELQGGTRELRKVFFENIPIPKIPTAKQRPFIHIVDSILQAKAANPGVNTRAAEVEIDQLVYQLYNLTDEEISLVES